MPRLWAKLTGRLTIASILLTMIVELLIWQKLPHNVFWATDPGLKMIQVINFSLGDQSLAYPGRIFDPERRFFPIRPPWIFEHAGKFYGVYSPIFIGLSAFFYHFLSFDGLYVIPLLASLVILLATAYLARAIAPGWAPLAVVLVGLCSPLLFYALNFWEHTLGVALATTSLACVWQGTQSARGGRHMFFSGLLAGAAYMFRPELAMWCLAMFISAWLGWPRYRRDLVVLFSLGVVCMASISQGYEWFSFGTFVRPNIATNYGPLKLDVDLLNWITKQGPIVLDMALPVKQRGIWIALWMGSIILAMFFFATRRDKHRALIRTLAILVTLAMAILIAWDMWRQRGFSDLTSTFPPICVVVLASMAPRRASAGNQQVFRRFLVKTVVIFLICASFTAFNDGGTEWGPRYLLAIIPAVALALVGFLSTILWPAEFAAHMIDRMSRRAMVLVLPCFVALGLFAQYRGISELYAQTALQQELIRQITAAHERIALTQSPYLAMGVAPIFYDKIFLRIDNQEQFEQLVPALRAHGVTEFIFIHLIIAPTKNLTMSFDLQAAPCACVALQGQSETFFQRDQKQAKSFVRYVIQHYRLTSK